jgi:4-hydroxybenzoate polyprenyltransferase
MPCATMRAIASPGPPAANGIVIEIGRKLRQPADEEEGVETYSRLWGKQLAAAVWLAALIATATSATLAATAIDFSAPVIVTLSIVICIAVVQVILYLEHNLSGKRIETVSALWTLALYLMLGLVPLWLR